MKTEKIKHVNKETGEIHEDDLGVVIHRHTVRPNGTLRVQQDFKNCPSMAEQHTAHLTDINYLMAKYRPDELAAYIAARNSHRTEILGHDFSQEPSLMDAKTVAYNLKKAFEELPDKIKSQFKNHVEFLKFIDNPINQEKMIELGLMTKKEINKHVQPLPSQNDDSNDETKTKAELNLKNPSITS